MSLAFLDTDILIHAALQPDLRSEQARLIVAQGGVISVQVLNEFAAVASRKLRKPCPEIERALLAIRDLFPEPQPLTAATHDAALDLAERLGCQFYDALILASALEAGCDTLLTEDLQHGQRIDGRLTIRNPFVAQ